MVEHLKVLVPDSLCRLRFFNHPNWNYSLCFWRANPYFLDTMEYRSMQFSYLPWLCSTTVPEDFFWNWSLSALIKAYLGIIIWIAAIIMVFIFQEHWTVGQKCIPVLTFYFFATYDHRIFGTSVNWPNTL